MGHSSFWVDGGTVSMTAVKMPSKEAFVKPKDPFINTIGLVPAYMRRRAEAAAREAAAAPTIPPYMADAAMKIDAMTSELRRRILANG